MRNSLSLLPLNQDELQNGVRTALETLRAEGLSDDEGMFKLGQDFDSWLDHGTRRQHLPKSVEPILSAAGWPAPSGQSRGKCYSSLVAKIAGNLTPDRRSAAMVLSNLPFILSMAADWKASSARIALLLRQADAGLSIGWRLVESILSHFKLNQTLDPQAVAALAVRDQEKSEAELGDATVTTVLEALETDAANAGLDAGFKTALGALLLPTSGKPFIPYLQALLYICTITHFFDHPPEFIYTYKPRGGVADQVFERFPKTLSSRGNPILNNFKAIDRIGPDWAESREDNRDQARALVTVVRGLSSLAWSPRCQMSALIRKSLVRFIQISTPPCVHLAKQTELQCVKRFLREVAKAPTNTGGVIEQRITDFFGVLEFALPQWMPRGLGDPVHATNSSSGKLGDCDFQDISGRHCIALEAHAGRLTDVYVKEHLRTLELNLPRRMKEWEHVTGLADWRVSLRFVVHDDTSTKAMPATMHGIPFEMEVETYVDCLERLEQKLEAESPTTLQLFNRWVIDPLDGSNTPHATKQRVASILESK